MRQFALLAVLGFLLNFDVNSQPFYDIKIPEKNFISKCKECLDLIKSKPREIQYGIYRDENDTLYFIVTRKLWFDLMIKNNGDGIAIDIVDKDRYDCSNRKLSKNTYVRGELQPPVYMKELRQNLINTNDGQAIIRLGPVPKKFLNKDIEFNFIFLKDKNYCHYNNFFDLKTYRWDLLDMGLYFDTITYKNSFDTANSDQERTVLQNKILKFEIPFEKNKSEYKLEDIKPLYDSLKLTDFDIQKITIRAYSSVEGNSERNMQLQHDRAQSIVNALQSFQKPSIKNDIQTSENWVEFFDDLSQSGHTELSNLTKDEIKERLNDKFLLVSLEPYLKNHRKAVVVLELQKKNKYRNIPVNELVNDFNKSIADNKLEEAIEIQNSIFERIKNKELPVNFIEKLEIPQRNEYGLLLNKNSIFKYLLNEADITETYKELNRLLEIMPNDSHIRYNVTSIKFRLWLLGKEMIYPDAFKKEIESLNNYDIPKYLIKRMLINYEIVMCEYYMVRGDYPNKDKSLLYIASNYKYIPLSDFDYLCLAQYLSSYARYDWAIKLLENKIKKIDVDEDLLFYYLNLTIVDDALTKRPEYRTVMLNAYNINKKRFCEMFNAVGSGGVSFQLLENDYLRKTYCESCK